MQQSATTTRIKSIHDPLTCVGQIGLYGNRYFNITDPQPEDVRIEDIASALSKVCRFGGQCNGFYSVAQHCVLASQRIVSRLALHALLHDASEAYIGDLVRPLKYMPEIKDAYAEIEERVQGAVYKRFGVEPTERDHRVVKIVDDCLVQQEAYHLMGQPEWSKDYGVKIDPWGPGTAYEHFLARFDELT